MRHVITILAVLLGAALLGRTYFDQSRSDAVDAAVSLQPGMQGDGSDSANGTAPAPDLPTASAETVDCREKLSPEPPEEPSADEKQHVLSVLQQSDSAEHQLAAILMGRWPGMTLLSEPERLEKLDEYLRQHPSSPMALFSLLNLCSDFLHEPACSDERLLRDIERLDPDNSETWALLAAYRAKRDLRQAAYTAMERAATATRTDDYIIEQLTLMERAYAAGNGFDLSSRVILAWGDVAANSGHWLVIYRVCESRAAKDPNWLRLCFDYGRRAELQSQTLSNESGALAIQRQMAAAAGDDEAVAAADKRLQDLRTLARNIDTETFNDDAANLAYLDSLIVGGERAAYATIRDIANRRLTAAECAGGF